MQNLTPEIAAFLRDVVYGGVLKRESATTRAVIEAMPADKADYRPDPNAKSAMELARHIAASENRFLDMIVRGTMDLNLPGIPESVKTPKELGEWYGAQFAANLERVNKLSGEELAKVADFRGVMQMPAVLFIPFLLHHSVHHRGQLSTYLRPMGGKVPAIYGESYDSAAAKKAAGG